MSMFLKLCHAPDPPVNCSIVLKKPESYSYSPGESVEGTLTVSLQKDLVFHGFKITIEGTALTKFKDTETSQSKTDNFLTVVDYAFGGGRVENNVGQKYRLAGGPTPHKFPFSLTFPSEPLPVTFKSPFGLVHYQVVAYMHMRLERFLKKAERPIIMNGVLNLDESTLNPVSCERVKSGGGAMVACGGGGGAGLGELFRFKMSLPQSGYLIGEEIPFQIELDNPNEYKIVSMSVTLIQKTSFRAGNLSKIVKSNQVTIATIESKNMDTPFGTMWGDGLRIPQNITPTQQKTIIEIQYALKVEVSSNEQGGILRGVLPIIIGTGRIGDPGVQTSKPGRSQQYLEKTGDDSERPPSYSRLSPRNSTKSRSSETLPPDYATAAFNSDGDGLPTSP